MAGGADSADAVAAALGDSELLSPEAYRKKYSMWVMPQDAPAPFQTFAQMSEQAQLPPRLLNAVSRKQLPFDAVAFSAAGRR
jgi:hypothetical protein